MDPRFDVDETFQPSPEYWLCDQPNEQRYAASKEKTEWLSRSQKKAQTTASS